MPRVDIHLDRDSLVFSLRRRIVKKGDRYYIQLPITHNDVWRKLHDSRIAVEVRVRLGRQELVVADVMSEFQERIRDTWGKR